LSGERGEAAGSEGNWGEELRQEEEEEEEGSDVRMPQKGAAVLSRERKRGRVSGEDGSEAGGERGVLSKRGRMGGEDGSGEDGSETAGRGRGVLSKRGRGGRRSGAQGKEGEKREGDKEGERLCALLTKEGGR
jgi:hypothetical protein